MNVSRILALGGSMSCIFREVWRIWRLEVTSVLRISGLGLTNLSPRVGAPKEHCSRASSRFVWRLDVTNVWRILALGGSMCRILRCLEALGAAGGWKWGMSRGSCPCGIPCIVFYDVWKLLGATDSNGFKRPGGSA